MLTTVGKEMNALFTLTVREVMRLVKSPGAIIANIIFPVIFLGLMGGSMSQNLAGNVGYDFLQFIMVGMIVFNMFMGTASGITSLVAEKQMNLTQELFVSPVSKYTIIIGRMLGTSIGSLFSLIGVLFVAFIMGIPFGGIQMLWLLLVTPVFCLSGASLGIFFIGFVQDPKVAQMGAMLIVMPQMFFSGTIIPISNSTGLIGVLTKLMPLTYITDLARGVFYWQKQAYDLVVINHPIVNIIITTAFILVFTVVGTIMYSKAERNR